MFSGSLHEAGLRAAVSGRHYIGAGGRDPRHHHARDSYKAEIDNASGLLAAADRKDLTRRLLAEGRRVGDKAGARLAGTPNMMAGQLHPYRDWDDRLRLKLASSGTNGFRNVMGDVMWIPAHRGP